MSESKHTPGPWEMHTGEDGAVVFHPDQGTIADIPIDLSAYPANTRLIAAAPELLKALEVAERILIDCDDRDELCGEEVAELRNIRAVLAKAKGTK